MNKNHVAVTLVDWSTRRGLIAAALIALTVAAVLDLPLWYKTVLVTICWVVHQIRRDETKILLTVGQGEFLAAHVTVGLSSYFASAGVLTLADLKNALSDYERLQRYAASAQRKSDLHDVFRSTPIGGDNDA